MVKRLSFMVPKDEKIFIINVCNWDFCWLWINLKNIHIRFWTLYFALSSKLILYVFCYIIAIKMNVSSIRIARHAGSWYPAQSTLYFMFRKHPRKRSLGIFWQRQKVTQHLTQPNQGHHRSSCRLSIQWPRCSMGLPVLLETSLTKPQSLLIGTFSS